MNPTCYMLIGLPGSGKSTLCESLIKDMPGIIVLSTDEYIEDYARKKGKRYEEVYREVGEDAQKWMNNRIRQLIKEKANFIWDQTNVYKSSRLKKTHMLAQNKYDVVALALDLSQEELTRRLRGRVEAGGKRISYKVIEEMKANYQLPSYSEGFKEVYFIADNNEYRLLAKPSLDINTL